MKGMDKKMEWEETGRLSARKRKRFSRITIIEGDNGMIRELVRILVYGLEVVLHNSKVLSRQTVPLECDLPTFELRVE